MSIGQKIVLPGDNFYAEVTDAIFKLSGAAIAISGGIATVTLASHLQSTGNFVTFSGVTGVTGLNNAVWGPITVTSSSVYTFPCALTGTPAGTIVQEPLSFPAFGQWVVTLGANAVIEYNPDNLFGANSPGSGGPVGNNFTGGYRGNVTPTQEVWRAFAAASTVAEFITDGFSFRIRHNGTTANTFLSQVK
jgi:hypothetical protein